MEDLVNNPTVAASILVEFSLASSNLVTNGRRGVRSFGVGDASGSPHSLALTLSPAFEVSPSPISTPTFEISPATDPQTPAFEVSQTPEPFAPVSVPFSLEVSVPVSSPASDPASRLSTVVSGSPALPPTPGFTTAPLTPDLSITPVPPPTPAFAPSPVFAPVPEAASARRSRLETITDRCLLNQLESMEVESVEVSSVTVSEEALAEATTSPEDRPVSVTRRKRKMTPFTGRDNRCVKHKSMSELSSENPLIMSLLGYRGSRPPLMAAPRAAVTEVCNSPDSRGVSELEEQEAPGSEPRPQTPIVPVSTSSPEQEVQGPYYSSVIRRGVEYVHVNDACLKSVLNPVHEILESYTGMAPTDQSSGLWYDPVCLPGSLKFLEDPKGYFLLGERKLLLLYHGQELLSYSSYEDSNVPSFLAVICLENSGRSLLIVHHEDSHAAVMRPGHYRIMRSYRRLTICRQTGGRSAYLFVKISASDLFMMRWSGVIDRNSASSRMSFCYYSVEDTRVNAAISREIELSSKLDRLVELRVLFERCHLRVFSIGEVSKVLQVCFPPNSYKEHVVESLLAARRQIVHDIEEMTDDVVRSLEEMEQTFSAVSSLPETGADQLVKRKLVYMLSDITRNPTRQQAETTANKILSFLGAHALGTAVSRQVMQQHREIATKLNRLCEEYARISREESSAIPYLRFQQASSYDDLYSNKNARMIYREVSRFLGIESSRHRSFMSKVHTDMKLLFSELSAVLDAGALATIERMLIQRVSVSEAAIHKESLRSSLRLFDDVAVPMNLVIE
ncbi:RhoA signaling inhibitor virus release protein [Eastern grey kangaroopox virus]|uniref:RhoA signaling inhibitor virus release protein n=1 Tax=Eastern grey kangaroopox virus TaxID=2042482 RepID=A0A2C9DSZ0_9POXV|nr:RhoA signaling inhibitor virus release protein [Eastern grey kangaroopox virus]ATI21123.1 RhoA signaling inhibitor virus release protein [Eastern grey kangaroopox virus]ATX75023.1 RhoA signaling inhibitor virus release protein [Eastern grey kangaroopox virus]